MTLIPGVAHAESKAKAEAKSETDAAKGESAKAGERAEETADGATEGAADDVVIDEDCTAIVTIMPMSMTFESRRPASSRANVGSVSWKWSKA